MIERYPNRPPIECADGFTMSVQASADHSCSPRNNEGPYVSFEGGFPSDIPGEELLSYAADVNKPTETVYPFVPREVFEREFARHGGVVKGFFLWS